MAHYEMFILDASGQWTTIGWCLDYARAVRWFHRYRRLQPGHPVRVIDQPSGLLMISIGAFDTVSVHALDDITALARSLFATASAKVGAVEARKAMVKLFPDLNPDLFPVPKHRPKNAPKKQASDVDLLGWYDFYTSRGRTMAWIARKLGKAQAPEVTEATMTRRLNRLLQKYPAHRGEAGQ